MLASHKWRELVSSGRLVCRCHDVFLWCYVCFCFASFSSLCFLRGSRGFSFNRPPSICRRPDSHTCFFVSYLEMSLFPSIFCTIAAFPLNAFEWSVRRTFFPSECWMVFFYLVTTGWIFDTSLLLCDNSMIQSIHIPTYLHTYIHTETWTYWSKLIGA